MHLSFAWLKCEHFPLEIVDDRPRLHCCNLRQVPSTVIPLLVIGALGYQPNVPQQNAQVEWALRLCFSIAPGLCILAGALALLW